MVKFYFYPTDEEVLRKKSEEVVYNKATKNLVRFLGNIVLQLKAFGVAAPQVGINKRVFVILHQGKFYAFINPEIVDHSKHKEYSYEACLSIPDTQVGVDRYYRINVKFLDLNGRERNEVFKGQLARIIQHELDHLNGTLIVDYKEQKDNE